MAKWYPRQQTGTADGTQAFRDRLDARQVGARHHWLVASKNSADAMAAADTMFLGRLRAGETLRAVTATIGGPYAGTVSIGTEAAPTKYANAVAIVVDMPVALGPNALQAAALPLAADEYVWATFSAGIGAAQNATVVMEVAGLN